MTITGTVEFSLRRVRTNSAPLTPGITWSVMMTRRLLARGSERMTAMAPSAVVAIETVNPAWRSTASRTLNWTGSSSMSRRWANRLPHLCTGFRDCDGYLRPTVALLGTQFGFGAKPIFMSVAVGLAALLEELIGAETNLLFQQSLVGGAIRIDSGSLFDIRLTGALAVGFLAVGLLDG